MWKDSLMDFLFTQGDSILTQLRAFTVPVGRALRVGLSGGIGTGKSTVAKVFSDLGATVADADLIARKIVTPPSPVLDAIAKAFGPEVLQSDGTLNRPYLAQQIFSDPQKRKLLESLTHPEIARRAKLILDGAPLDGIAVYDVPLLVENRMESDFDVVLMVDAPLNVRINRLAQRGLSECDARQRIAGQASMEQRRSVAHFWFNNAGTVQDTTVVTTQLCEYLKELHVSAL